MTKKYYYALKQQEMHNKIPLNSNIKPPKYWIEIGIALLALGLIIICA